MTDKKETPGQKLDRSIAEEERRKKMVTNLISGLTQEELKTLARVVHVKLHGDGEDD